MKLSNFTALPADFVLWFSGAYAVTGLWLLKSGDVPYAAFCVGMGLAVGPALARALRAVARECAREESECPTPLTRGGPH